MLRRTRTSSSLLLNVTEGSGTVVDGWSHERLVEVAADRDR
jgi:hypothetical protein